jgi:hypothetical protein
MKEPYSNFLEASLTRHYRKKKKDIQLSKTRDIASQFPFKALQRLADGSQGISHVDYGGHFLTLNCTAENGGKLTIGFFYENDQKIKAYGTTMCQNSKKYLVLLKLIESSIKESTKIDHPTTFLRAQFLFGAYTQMHTDSFRGNWYSYIMAFDAGYELSILLFPNFRTSVVEVSGSNYIPLSYSPLHGFLAITFSDNQPMRRVILHPEAYKTCIPVGDFDFVVVGVKASGKIQVAPLGYKYVATPKDYYHLSQEEASKRMTEKTTKPKKIFKSFNKLNIWNQFVPWQNIHWLSSGNNVRRISVFFRPLREVPTSNNFTFKGDQNWEDLRHVK